MEYLSSASLTWSVSLAFALTICLSYYLRTRRRLRIDASRKAEAVKLGIDRPMAQFPFVDPLRCAGCATCVAACPEGDVLGVVAGIAVVINGLRCIGIGACEEACPVGAIEVAIGDLRSREDVPFLDDSLETNLPGVFIAGELGGLSLVSNAIRQGRSVAENVAERVGSGAETNGSPVVDLAIVGAGPAGLSAALTARSAGISYALLEREKGLGGTVLNYPRRKMVLTQPVDLPPWGKLSRSSYEKEELLELFERVVEEAGLKVRFGELVKNVTRENGHYILESSEQIFKARNVLLALGRRGNPRKLGVPGEESGKVMYRLIDASSYSDQKILVVGGGDSAVEAAMSLARGGANEVTISYRKERLFRIKQKNQTAIDKAIEQGTVRPLFSSQVEEISPKSVRLRVDAEGLEEIENDFVFVFIGGVPPFGLLRQLGIRFGGEDKSDLASTTQSAIRTPSAAGVT